MTDEEISQIEKDYRFRRDADAKVVRDLLNEIWQLRTELFIASRPEQFAQPKGKP